MDNVIAVAVNENNIKPHELAVVTELKPDFLPHATLVQAEGQKALLYSYEGLSPLAFYGDGNGGMSLTLLFGLLTGYIKCLLRARDMLLDTRLLSSDPEAGVFVMKESKTSVIVKAVWGADTVAGDGEKICRVAQALAGRERVMGAKISMERTIELVRSENLSLAACLKAAEKMCREWNHITAANT